MHDILILGSGGREHTLTWKLSQSPLCDQIFIAPGNGGTKQLGTNLDIDIQDFKALGAFCDEKEIKYVIVGPELPLVHGIVDYFKINHPSVYVLGPDKSGARLEGSKDFANTFMAKYEIPTASFKTFGQETIENGKEHLRSIKGPYVLKADGLAAGKGVVILEDQEEAIQTLEEMLSGKFGDASSKVVIEEFLDGIEFSVFAITDGKNYQILPSAKDYKRIGENDKGLNTGGMGAISPVPFVDRELQTKVIEKIVEPTIKGIAAEAMDYKGFVFFGLIKVGDEPFVIEYNCRLGDPETEVILPRLNTDLMQIIINTFDEKLDSQIPVYEKRTAATVMLVSGGYPEKYEKGKEIIIPKSYDSSILFHAGTKINDEGVLATNGGRVMSITSFGEDHKEAVSKSMKIGNEIHFDGKYFRKDIGFDL